MTVPSEIRILGKTYTINAYPDTPLSDPDVSGGYIIHLGEIGYREGHHPEQIKDNIFHEVLHILSHCGQLELEERQVHVLATLLLAVLLDNPEFVRYLASEKKDL